MSEPAPNIEQPCPHLAAGAPLPGIVAVIDDQLGMTDGIVRCCTHYLLEMLDWRGNTRLFRLRRLPSGTAESYLKNLARGSCDLSRRDAETHQLTTLGNRLPALLEVDLSSSQITNVLYAARKPPTASWRDLPCSGDWFDEDYRNTIAPAS